jgi:hypothetical protein
LDEFVSRGMIVDFAIHDPDKKGGIPNPYVHFICPIRPLKENGEWDAKQHRKYVLDEHGERVRDDAGHDVFNAVPTTDWGRPETLEHWRAAWAKMVNEKFAEKNLPCRIDHRSYERQGVEQLPTVHEGPAVRQMEARGFRTDKGDLNRWIRNDLLRKIKTKISEFTDWLKAADEELSNANCPSLAEILGDFYQARNAGAWSDKAKVGNLKRYAADIAFLESKGVTTVDDLHDFVSAVSDEYFNLRDSLKTKSNRMKDLQTLLRLAADYSRLKPIVDAIPAKGGFGKKHEKYVAEHDSEISQFYAVRRKLDNAVSDKKLTVKAWQAEFDQLSQEYAAESAKLKPMWDDLKKLNDLQYKVDNTLHDQQRSPQKQKNYEQEI